jgi:uncharacterized protein YceH (UPF0502 family)
MDFILDTAAVRVLGSLIEKEVTTPDYYPLSLNALVNACNQKSNREPVMQLSEEEVTAALDTLKEKHLVWQRSVAGARVYKYEHNIRSFFPFSEQELGALCVLMLRGPQTIGEVRTRTDRLCTFSSLEAAEKVVRDLISAEKGPFVLELPRQPGRKEPRFVHLFSGLGWAESFTIPGVADAATAAVTVQTGGKSLSERIVDLETNVAVLQDELRTLREEFAGFRRELE